MLLLVFLTLSLFSIPFAVASFAAISGYGVTNGSVFPLPLFRPLLKS